MSSLGLSIYHATGEFCPRFQYDASAGRLSKVDRSADGATNVLTDLTMNPPPLAFDLGTMQIGWANFQRGGTPSVVMVPFGQPMPARPDPAHKAGFRTKVWDGVEAKAREFGATAGVTVNAIEALWDQLTAMPEAAAGKVPVIRLVNVVATKAGQSTNYAPVFSLVTWVERDERVFGPRTVAAPGQPPIVPVAATLAVVAAPVVAPPVAFGGAAPAAFGGAAPAAFVPAPPAPTPAAWPAAAA